MPGVDLRGDVYLGSWTQIPSTGPGSIREASGAQIVRPRQDESAQMTPSSATMTLDNRDFRWTIRNPASPWYGQLVQNTPLRLSVPASAAGLSNYLRLEGDTTSSVTTPDSVGLQITGVLDVRVDCQPSDYQTNVLAAKYGATAKSWAFVFGWDTASAFLTNTFTAVASGTLGLYWFDGANTQFIQSNATLPYYGQRICLRVLFTPATGTAQFYTAATMAGPFTQLGTNVVFGATTLNAGVGQAVQVGGQISLARAGHSAVTFNSMLGAVYEAQVLSVAVVKADPVFSSQTAGAGSFTDAQSNTWTLNGTAEISDRLYRYHGELGSLPKAADPAGREATSAATAYGIWQRLSGSNTPLQSPMRRAYVRLPAALNLAAYWPLEDGTNSTSMGSAMGGPPMSILGSPVLASNSSFACSLPIPAMNNGAFGGVVSPPAGVTFTDASVRVLVAVPAGGDTNGAGWLGANYSGGPIARTSLVYGTGGTLNMTAYNAAGGVVHSTGAIGMGAGNGQLLRVAMDLHQNGGNIDMVMATLAPGASSAGVFTASSVAAGTVGACTQVNVGFLGAPTVSAFGHLSVQGVADSLFDIAGPLLAWNGEPAAARVVRLCGEESITCRIIGAPDLSMPMGNQPVDTLPNILQQCEDTDLGLLFEPRQALGIGYRTRTSMYHQAAVCTPSYTAQGVSMGFSSTSDTQLAVNDVTATAPDGSTARQFLPAGAMSVLAPPNGISRVDTQISPNPAADSNLNQLASWNLSVRSADDDRYPAIPLNMARAATPQTAALLDIGDYLKITGTPAWLPPPPVSQLVAGYAETIGPQPQWLIAVNGIPERPYETAQAGTGASDSAHADTAGSQLNSGCTATPATISVATTLGPVWTQAAASFPLDIIIEGEQKTVSGISSATSPQTFTISANSVNGVVKSHLAGAKVSLYHKPIAAL